MQIQPMSDLHAEIDPLRARRGIIDRGADLVILAGDIDRGGEGVRWAASTWPNTPVVYVLGNHEAYGSSIETSLEQCRAAAEGTRVHVLEREAITVAGVRVLGATLWTDFCLLGAGDRMRLSREKARQTMTDYRAIERGVGYQGLRPEDTQARHHETVAWLETALAQQYDGPTVVVTHHAPHGLSLHPELKGTEVPLPHKEIDTAYASDLTWLIKRYVPAVWIHGHTHLSHEYAIGATRVLSNQRGYYGEMTTWDPSLLICLAD